MEIRELKWLLQAKGRRLSEKQIYFRSMFAVFLTWAMANGYQFSIGEVFRPGKLKFICPHCKKKFEFMLQNVYVYMGRSKVRHSKHQDKLAVDIFLLEEGKFITDVESYRPLGNFWKSLDPKNRWGGDFRIGKLAREFKELKLSDPFHFEFAG